MVRTSKRVLAAIVTLCLMLTITPATVFASTNENDENTLFSGGKGTEANPYIVSTTTDVLNIANHLDCHFLQIGDISFQGVEYSPIGTKETPFTGRYDGNGFSIKDISFVSKDTQYSGLFGYSLGTISNVKLKNCSFDVSSGTTTLYCGAIAGYNEGTISSCVVDADINASAKGEDHSAYAGGICGFSEEVLKKCSFYGEVISAASYINRWDSIIGDAFSGGIAAVGGAQDCDNHGNISSIVSAPSGSSRSTSAYAGGIVAQKYYFIAYQSEESFIINCYNDGNIVAKNAQENYAGGICAHASCGYIMSCKNDGSVYASSNTNTNTNKVNFDTYSGGICGNTYCGGISYCENGGNIDADSTSGSVHVGGIAGYNEVCLLQDSKNYGTISGYSASYSSNVGGIAGCSFGRDSAKRCCNNGEILSNGITPQAGGIFGYSTYSRFYQCCNHGTITVISRGTKNDGTRNCVGGVVGSSHSTMIFDCYNDGNVIMEHTETVNGNVSACGGICGEIKTQPGYDTSTCVYCYNVGDLAVICKNSKIGGIQGLERFPYGNEYANIIENCYALNVYDDPYAIEMSDSESRVKETYVGFDFENIWAIDPSINGGRPYIATIPNDDNENWYSNKNIAVSLASSSAKLGIGKEKTLSVISDLESEDLIWTTSDSDIVTVDDGVITGVAKGKAIIKVTNADKTRVASCVVSVVDGDAFSISGKISGYGDNSNVKIELLESGDIVTVKDSNNYQIEDVFPGVYTVRVSKSKHCAREYEVVVTDSDVTLNVEIWLYGDVNADGTIDHVDVLQINRNIASQTSVFDTGTDELKAYRFKVANVTAINGSDIELNHIDVLQINRKKANLTSIFDSLS